jgi:propionyl-CoA carboxylase alpha chain
MITRILVANRGEIARRVFRTCREMGISTVAVYSDPDRTEPHAREAEQAVHLPGSTPGETYLDIEAILAAAKTSGADAVHPGYGFLSENADFARAVIENGLTWIGPSPKAIEAMGSKVEAKRLMEAAGVPTLPSYEVTGTLTVQSAGLAVGFPALVKASAGGGGKGMRLVYGPEELKTAIETAEREAFRSFGDHTVFIEKYLAKARHIEVQVLGDTHGNILSLYERECSIQRRHQKIIEESPSPAMDDQARAEIGAVAVEAARAVGYVGAGTVEFLYEQGKFYFLEMNTRLQVEHPVTEMVTGLDLVRLQIEIANGEEIGEIPPVSGHAIEARIYAEDPANEFLPTTGLMEHFEFPDLQGLRVDAGVESGSNITIHYDPMIAKVIAHAPTRDGAAALLASALRGARVHGPTNNIPLLVGILEHPEFLAGDTDTRFLERNDAGELSEPLLDSEHERLAAVAAALADQAAARKDSSVLSTVPSGWRNTSGWFRQRSYVGERGRHDIRYLFTESAVTIDGPALPPVVEVSSDAVIYDKDGERIEFTVARYGTERRVDSSKGPVRLSEVPRFGIAEIEDVRGSLHAPMPGVVLRVDVLAGQRVAEGEVLLVLEAMKMEHTLRSPHAGRVAEVRCGVGDQVEGGTVLAVIEEE